MLGNIDKCYCNFSFMFEADAVGKAVLKKLHLKKTALHLLPWLWIPIVPSVYFYKTVMKTYSFVVNSAIQALECKQTCSSLDLWVTVFPVIFHQFFSCVLVLEDTDLKIQNFP